MFGRFVPTIFALRHFLSQIFWHARHKIPEYCAPRCEANMKLKQSSNAVSNQLSAINFLPHQ